MSYPVGHVHVHATVSYPVGHVHVHVTVSYPVGHVHVHATVSYPVGHVHVHVTAPYRVGRDGGIARHTIGRVRRAHRMHAREGLDGPIACMQEGRRSPPCVNSCSVSGSSTPES